MKGRTILMIVACLVIGTRAGYAIGDMRYVPQIKSRDIQISELMSEVSGLEQTISSQVAQITEQEAQISSQVAQITEHVARIFAQESQISTLESDKATLLTDLEKAQSQANYYQAQFTTAESQLKTVEKRLDSILGITVTQHYDWVYRYKPWQWELPIPLSVYVEYLERPRPESLYYYVDMATDPGDDSVINQIAQRIDEVAQKERYTDIKKLNFAIAFVQSLPYSVDIETKPYDEYPRYPVETLFDRGGDCEDTSILAAALLDSLGYDVALLLLEDAHHMAVGVSISGTHGSYYEYDGKRYFYLETTGEGWQIGQIPPDISPATARIFPLGS